VGEFSYFIWNPDDHSFALIEITDSEQIASLIRSNRYAEEPAGERLGGVVSESDLKHFRIGFDHYGYFDVLCFGIEIREVVPSAKRA
jgi:hypothetical protein